MNWGKVKRSLDIYDNQVCYSQEGEDLILSHYFGLKENGFYVDIGAYHPKKLSNTALFYQKGWCGINVEPNKKSWELLKKKRPRDINLNLGVDSEPGFRELYLDDACSSFDGGWSSFRGKEEVKVTTLALLLEAYLPFNQPIDFLSVDTEGNDLVVLKSNDWKKYRPKLVLVELLRDGWDIVKFMGEQNYGIKYRTYLNGIFERLD